MPRCLESLTHALLRPLMIVVGLAADGDVVAAVLLEEVLGGDVSDLGKFLHVPDHGPAAKILADGHAYKVPVLAGVVRLGAELGGLAADQGPGLVVGLLSNRPNAVIAPK